VGDGRLREEEQGCSDRRSVDAENQRRYPYTAIDDATRVRAPKIYKRHTQANAIDFIDYVGEKFPFRIQIIRTDRGHEFQALFHWHVADQGMEHVYIKPKTPYEVLREKLS
jgi:hypothetical protein